MNKPGFLRRSIRRELGLGPTGPSRRLATGGAALLLAIAFAPPALTQTTFHQEIIRGFSSLGVGFRARPALADIDGDGDLDAIVGRAAGDLRYFENTGEASSPSFVERTGNLSPFPSWVSVYAQSAPAFGDLDGDGDLDLAIGRLSGRFTYFKNTGSSSFPRFLAPQSGPADPFGSLPTLNPDITPALEDLDGDGDLDIVTGDRQGLLGFLENTGSPALPALPCVPARPVRSPASMSATPAGRRSPISMPTAISTSRSEIALGMWLISGISARSPLPASRRQPKATIRSPATMPRPTSGSKPRPSWPISMATAISMPSSETAKET
jgi:hypothetical protein